VRPSEKSIYAVGGNREAARLAGIDVNAVAFLVYLSACERVRWHSRSPDGWAATAQRLRLAAAASNCAS
jgi:predicted ABC-type sugar transport system permease subunit